MFRVGRVLALCPLKGTLQPSKTVRIVHFLAKTCSTAPVVDILKAKSIAKMLYDDFSSTVLFMTKLRLICVDLAKPTGV